jgi:hypothetical protein
MPPPAKREGRASISAMAAGLPLPTLLSQALVAFTIEFDNEFERQMPHRRLLATIEECWQERFGKGTNRWPSGCARTVGRQTRHGDLTSVPRIATLPPTGGERRSAKAARCRTIPWCCTAADSLMAVFGRRWNG